MTTTIHGVTITLTPEQIEKIEQQQEAQKELLKKFKVGTRVICTTNVFTNGIQCKGMLGTIIEVPAFPHRSYKVQFDRFIGPTACSANTFELVPESITDMVKSWEDAVELVQPLYWATHRGMIDNYTLFVHGSSNHLTVPSEARAKSVLAYCKLAVIAEALNEGWSPNWRQYNQSKWHIVLNHDKKCLEPWYNCYVQFSVLYFASEKLAQHTITHFSQLWYDYFMVENPNNKQL